jgi:hypothetical protein
MITPSHPVPSPHTLWSAALLCAALLVLGPGQAQAASRLAKTQGLSNADLRLGFADPDLAGHGNLSDQVTLRARLDDGSNIYLRFLATNVATADADAEIKANVTHPNRPRLTGKERRPGGSWATAKTHLSARVGHSRFDIRVGAASFRFRHKDFDLDLELRTSLKPIRPKGGSAKDGSDDFYMTTLLAVRGRLTGTLTIHGPSGDEETDVRGVGFLEHRLGTIKPYNLAKSWVNVRVMNERHTLISSTFRRPSDEGGGDHGWLVYATDKGVQLLVPQLKIKELEHKTDGKTRYRVPRLISLTRPGGARVGTVQATKLIKRRDDLGSLGSLVRFVVERFMKPWTFEHEATFRLGPPGGVPASGKTEYIYQRLN